MSPAPMPPFVETEETAAAAYLYTPLAIRARCENVFAAAQEGKLAHFAVDPAALPAIADRVAAVTRAQYPSLDIPVHGRLGHFRAGGIDRVKVLDGELAAAGAEEAARAWVDLVVVSVLVDAGAGLVWRYREAASGAELARSEGLAVASLHAFRAGLFSADPARPLRVDAAALENLDARRFAEVFQVGPGNQLVGVEGRLALLRELGRALRAHPMLFPEQRPGGMVTALLERTRQVSAAELLSTLLLGFGSIWPGRLSLGGLNLGDTWRHPAAGGTGPSAGLVPFHKLSQWLCYSLFEPLERAGIAVLSPGALTGLPEYRNGGLFIDLGALVPRHHGVLAGSHGPGDEIIVEWRALTVALLDRVADLVRQRLGKTADQLPLARILEGGTWATGRAVAAEKRSDGSPPLRVDSDGTVF